MKLKEMLLNAINAGTIEEKLELLDELQREILNQDIDHDTAIEYLDRIFKLKSSILNEKKYSLQMIKNIISNIEKEKRNTVYIKIGMNLSNEVYGIFGKDNTFCLAESCNKLFNQMSYLSDIATDSVLTSSYKKNKSPWVVDGIVNISGVESYVVPSSKLFDKEIDPAFVSKDYVNSVNQSVNVFLEENPRFVLEVFDTKVYKR